MINKITLTKTAKISKTVFLERLLTTSTKNSIKYSSAFFFKYQDISTNIPLNIFFSNIKIFPYVAEYVYAPEVK